MSNKKTASSDLGLRERNKEDKLARIKFAARDTFIKKGFDEATIRQIASLAGVAFGTVFRYASDKRDLLFLIYNDDLDELSDTAFLNIDQDEPFIVQLIAIFRKFYQFFAERPELARDVLREMSFYKEGSQAERFRDSILRIEKQMEEFVIRCGNEGLINKQLDQRIVAHLLFGIYRTEVRRWLSRSELDVDKGMDRLRSYLEVAIIGLAPSKKT